MIELLCLAGGRMREYLGEDGVVCTCCGKRKPSRGRDSCFRIVNIRTGRRDSWCLTCRRIRNREGSVARIASLSPEKREERAAARLAWQRKYNTDPVVRERRREWLRAERSTEVGQLVLRRSYVRRKVREAVNDERRAAWEAEERRMSDRIEVLRGRRGA